MSLDVSRMSMQECQSLCLCTYHIMLAGVLREVSTSQLSVRQQNLLNCLQPNQFSTLIRPVNRCNRQNKNNRDSHATHY